MDRIITTHRKGDRMDRMIFVFVDKREQMTWRVYDECVAGELRAYQSLIEDKQHGGAPQGLRISRSVKGLKYEMRMRC